MQTTTADLVDEARRQAEICNACRYCEGYCAVFPDLHANRVFTSGDLTQLANLCHNCRGCYYACQYTAPHEFDLNLPRALADLRQASWEDFAWPQPLARRFHRDGVALSLAVLLGFAALFLAIGALPGEGDGFYAQISHGAMVAIFLPAFLFPLLSLAISMRRYWAATGGGGLSRAAFRRAFGDAVRMKNLAGGHGEGCNFEAEDRFSQARRRAHQAVMWGFLLCFASTASGTLLHYLFNQPAPYPLWSLPKLLGLPGGVLMVLGCFWLASLKRRADPELGARAVRGGEMGFLLL
ncbi:MAG: tricarballylate utilization 4Fe-4S protein TcuB [Silicimonas sp.]|nr:tricarballylate utilization 4Fe-4S protein TcuB [Silicimonas sp.]